MTIPKQMETMTPDELTEIHNLAMKIVDTIMETVAPDSDQILVRDLALGALASKWAGEILTRRIKEL